MSCPFFYLLSYLTVSSYIFVSVINAHLPLLLINEYCIVLAVPTMPLFRRELRRIFFQASFPD